MLVFAYPFGNEGVLSSSRSQLKRLLLGGTTLDCATLPYHFAPRKWPLGGGASAFHRNSYCRLRTSADSGLAGVAVAGEEDFLAKAVTSAAIRTVRSP